MNREEWIRSAMLAARVATSVAKSSQPPRERALPAGRVRTRVEAAPSAARVRRK